MKSKTIVFIHGMFMTPLCWEHWRGFFEAEGYRCLAPGWPGREGTPEALRRKHPDPQLGQLTLGAILESLAAQVGQLEEKPILIGHSMGGLLVQLLRGRGLAAASVAVHSAPPVGVFSTRWSHLKSNWPAINPFVPKTQPLMLGQDEFNYAFVNGLPAAEQRAAYERYAVPETRQVARDSLGATGKVDFAKAGPPLLFLAGTQDHIIPASLNRSNQAQYGGQARVDFKEFPRTHFVLGQQGWQEVAGHVAGWLDEVSG